MNESIHDAVRAMRVEPKKTGCGLLPGERRAALLRLAEEIKRREGDLCAALKSDLNKSETEAYMTEIGMVLSEIAHAARHVEKWAKPRRARTPLAQFPARSDVIPEPYGVALIMAPWNYPFQLSLSPLVGALAAGCRAVLKPSNYAPATAGVIEQIVAACFPKTLVCVVQGGREANAKLLDERFDIIFFTGGVTVGKLVLQKAAEHVTPVVLELGGKSPCIVDDTADLALSARRIAFGKGLNSGQTCVAPDYLLVQRGVRDALLSNIAACWREFYGDALQNPDWPRMVNEKHFARVLGLIEGETVFCGGRGENGRIEPTILTDVTERSPVMNEEIFGPVLPVIAYDTLEEAIAFVNAREKPLALYLFTRDENTRKTVLSRVPFGGGCVNDTIIHLATSAMPFGGVGQSGMGNYHGKRSFDAFTHEKSVVQKGFGLDLTIRYAPYTEKKRALIKRFMR